MYGMVNDGIGTFIKTHFGVDDWHSICKEAGIAHTEFERMSTYDDKLTYDLVGAVSRRCNLPPEQVLETFGNYWIEFAGKSNFSNLMQLAGRNFVERIASLDDMHERIQMSMPDLQPPSFEIEEIGEDTYRIRYYSHREGLAPMVIGLLYGLAADVSEKISVRHVEAKSADLDHDVFDVVVLEGNG